MRPWHVALVAIIGTWLAGCAGPAHVRETVARPRIASNSTSLPKQLVASKAARAATRGAKDYEIDEPQDFSGVAVAAPKEDRNAKIERQVDVEGIEGTMTEFDVRTPLEERDADFNRCHDEHRGGSGRIVFHIHILANGDVGNLKAHASKVRNKDIIECYSEVVSSTHFPKPHGGYADVKWTTKVGRSKKKKDPMFDRKVRWDTPSSGATSINTGLNRSADNDDDSSSKSSRRERRHRHRSHRHRKGA